MPINVQFPLRFRVVAALGLSLSLVTGLLLFVLTRWGEVEGEFGLTPHPWISSLLPIHGVGAFFMILVFGFLLGTHVPAAWRVRRSRKSGLLLLTLHAALITTGYLLYYLGDYREFITYIHLAVGCLYPCMIGFHVWLGKRHARSLLQQQ